MTDKRLRYAATERNRDPILQVLRAALPASGLVLEIASGSGEHVVHFARALPHLRFQPSDPDPRAMESIAAWTAHEALDNVLPPVVIDAMAHEWPIGRADAILCINMVHIAPWAASEGLMQRAGAILRAGAPLILYGPYRRQGVETAPSNEAFDQSLKSRNPEWGLRQLEDVAALARANGLEGPDVVEMPANNLCLVFRKQ